jgi:hypothetical protein
MLRSVTIADKQILETDLYREIDNAAAPVIARMIADPAGALTLPDMRTAARFLLALPARNPWGIARAMQFGRDAFSGNLSDPQDARALGLPDRQTIFEAIEKENPHFVADMARVHAAEVHDDPAKVSRLLGMRWSVLDLSGAGTDLVVGDRPLIRHGPLMEGPTILGLPLSPTRLLAISDQPMKRMRKSKLIALANYDIVKGAVQHFYATNARHKPLAWRHLRDRKGDGSDLIDF